MDHDKLWEILKEMGIPDHSTCLLRNLYACQEASMVQGFPGTSAGKESTCKAGLIPGSGISAGEGIGYPFQYSWASLVVQMGKNLSAMWETWVRSLGWEDPRRRAWQPTPVFWPREFHGLPAIFIWFLKPVAYLE